jgi:hypothetical protein
MTGLLGADGMIKDQIPWSIRGFGAGRWDNQRHLISPFV